jgi:hypothetical protein
MAPKKRVVDDDEDEQKLEEIIYEKKEEPEDEEIEKLEKVKIGETNEKPEMKYPSMILSYDKKTYEEMNKPVKELTDIELMRILITRTEGKYKLNRVLKDTLRAMNSEINFPSYYQKHEDGHRFNENSNRGGFRGGRGGFERGGFRGGRPGFEGRGGYGRKQRDEQQHKKSFFDDDDDNVR